MGKREYKKFDLGAARSTYGTPNFKYGCMYMPWPGRSLDYSHGYVATNEDLRHTTGLTRDMARKVLTIAGSGDQALFYQLNGATKIDTFDVSFCAGAIQDIKSTAIKLNLPYDEYNRLLNDLHFAHSASRVENMPQILDKASPKYADFVRNMDGYKIFGAGLSPNLYQNQILDADEYAKLQSDGVMENKFIWANASDVHAHLVEEYDVINLSNIFEWAPGIMIPTLASLRNHVRPGGYILVQTGCGISIGKNFSQFRMAQEKFKKWAKMGINKQKREDQVVILERVR
ncbi:MAG: DUF3419 family protein [Alphaproteobacteria bacterium]|nr:DUF3419 family protein [Alphaproteobacteria bacterium]